MTKRCSMLLLFLSIWPLTSVQAEEADCDTFEMTVRKPPRVYKPFPMQDPATGKPYAPDDKVTFTVNGEKKELAAKDLFAQLNSIEQKLNEIGYSIRDTGADTLGGIFYCAGVLRKQEDVAGRAVKNLLASDSFGDFTDKVKAYWDDYKDSVADTWQDIQENGADADFEMYFPDPPPRYSPPAVANLDPVELKVIKEKTWSFEKGDKKKFFVAGSASYHIKGDKLQVEAGANGNVRSAVLEKEEEVLSAEASAQSMGKESGKIGIALKVFGKEVWAWRKAGIASWSLADKQEESIDKSYKTRFMIGPIPCAAEVGFRGGVGIDYGIELTPFQVGAHATPYAFADAYARAGVDVVAVAAGVGGELVLVEVSIPIRGNIGFNYTDQPEFVYSLTANTNLRALAGSLYLYAKVYFIVWEKEFRYDLFKWEAVNIQGNIFDYHGKLTRGGLEASGDLSADDLLEQQQQNDLVALRAQIESKEKQLQEAQKALLVAIQEDLSSVRAREIAQRTAGLVSQLAQGDQALDNLRRTLQGIGQ